MPPMVRADDSRMPAVVAENAPIKPSPHCRDFNKPLEEANPKSPERLKQHSNDGEHQPPRARHRLLQQRGCHETENMELL